MQNQKRVKCYRIFLWVLLCGSILTIAAVMMVDIYRAVPDTIYLKAGEKTELSLAVPLSGKVRRLSAESTGQEKQGIAQKSGAEAAQASGEVTDADAESRQVLSADIQVDFSKSVSLVANSVNEYCADLKLFGIIPFKTVKIEVINDKMVYPAGIPIGIYVKTNGVLVIGTSDFTSVTGDVVMPSDHLLQVGDYILAVNGEEIDSKRRFVELVAESDGKTMIMTIDRDGAVFDIGIKPQQDEAGEYKLGIWIKDSAQGIGTLTYIDQEGDFGALGHGVSDTDTGIMLEMSEGALYRTDIIGITRGIRGTPGELTGVIRYTESNRIGVISNNEAVGIHGNVGMDMIQELGSQPVEIALKQEVVPGEAYLYCLIQGEPDFYRVEITGIDYDGGNVNKGISLRVTDERLLALTGGIVQGMSGSPLLQGGKLIGAVTHVLVDDPAKGYGIFIENMLE